MNHKSKFLFDENIGPSLVEEISRLLLLAREEEHAEVKHVHTLQRELGFDPQGIWDEKWIPELKAGDWTVIAGDRGRGGIAKGDKLPNLCVKHGIVHIMLSPRVHHRHTFKKLLTILSVWHELLELTRSPPGSRFLLEPLSQDATASGRGKLTPRPYKASPPDGQLF